MLENRAAPTPDSAPSILRLVEEFWTGFQSGVDQAVARFAQENGKPLRGWVPDHFRAETVLDDGSYQDTDFGVPEELLEKAGIFLTTERDLTGYIKSDSRSGEHKQQVVSLLEEIRKQPTNPALRTELLVITTDATLVISSDHEALLDGTVKMFEFAKKYGKPLHVIALDKQGEVTDAAVEDALRWLEQEKPRRLNIGGPRASHGAQCGYPPGDAAEKVLKKLCGEK